MAMMDTTRTYVTDTLLLVRMLLVAMPGAPSSFLLLVVRPGAPSGVLAPTPCQSLPSSRFELNGVVTPR